MIKADIDPNPIMRDNDIVFNQMDPPGLKNKEVR